MKKALVFLAVFALVGACVFGVGVLMEPATQISAVTSDSACPAVGCASGQCHGFGDVPEPDGVHEMICPEAGCSSVECHAWDTLQGRYKQASDASMNLWILAPVVLVIALVVLVGALSKPERQEGSGVAEAAGPDEEEMPKEADA